jgi:hypothetical protein
LPEKPKIVSLNGDTSQSIKLCSVIPGSVRVKVDSTETIQKFTAEVSIDSLFTNIKSFESTNSAVTVDISNTGRYFTRVKTSNKNGSSPYSETKSFTISQIPTAPSLSRDTENNLIANSNGITWFKDGVKISDTSQKFKPTSNGFFTATTTQNGCTSAVSANYYYLTSAVTNLSSNEYFKVSPNPTNGDIYVNYNITSTNDIYISIIDMSGRTINTNRKVNNGSKINFGSAMKGSYIIQVKDKSGRILTTEKIVKN